MILAVDPGIRGCGVAIFTTDGRLAACAYVNNPASTKSPIIERARIGAKAVDVWRGVAVNKARDAGLAKAWEGVQRLVVEFPRIRTITKSKGDNNDLLPMCAVDGAIAALFDVPCEQLYPDEWKNQTDTEEVVDPRIRARLSAEEIVVYEAGLATGGKTYGHNTMDAVGVGLKFLGRYERKRVIPA